MLWLEMLKMYGRGRCSARPVHIYWVTAYADQHGIAEPTSRLMNQLGLLLLTKAGYSEAELLMKRALAIDEVSYGPEHAGASHGSE